MQFGIFTNPTYCIGTNTIDAVLSGVLSDGTATTGVGLTKTGFGVLQVSGTNSVGGGTTTIAGQVPLSELSGYQTRLNSVTGGQGSYTLELSHYDAVPPGVQKSLMEAYKPKVEE